MNGAGGNGSFGWTLVIVGLVLAGIGLIWVLAPNLPRLGRLPGDIVIERENSRFYFPIVTCIVISAVLSLIMWLIREENKAMSKMSVSRESGIWGSSIQYEKRTKGTFLIVVARCLVCGKPVCLHHAIYQSNLECPLRGAPSGPCS